MVPVYGQGARYERGYIPWPAPMQFIDRILRPCASGATPYVSAIAASDGDLDLTTCAGRSVTINGTPITPGGGITGSGTTNTITKWTGATAIGNSRLTDDGTTIDANSGAGTFQAGDTAFAANGNVLTVSDSGNIIDLLSDGNGSGQGLTLSGTAQTAVLSASGAGGTVQFTLSGATNEAIITTPVLRANANGTTDLGTAGTGYRQLFVDATITAGGTTGNQTINKSAGSVNFAAAATSLVVTSNKVTTNSVVICTVGTNDTTLKSVQCVAAAGSFTMFANAAATAETRVNFWILNQ